MKPSSDLILYPAIGCPFKIESSDSLDKTYSLFISTDQDLKNALIEARIIPVSGSANADGIQLNILSVNMVETRNLSSTYNFSNWILENYKVLFEIKYALSEKPVLVQGISRLYDLQLSVDNLQLIKNSCIYISDTSSVKTVFHATDVHISKRWDDIDKEMKEVLPLSNRYDTVRHTYEYTNLEYADFLCYKTFQNSYSNPNQNFIRFIEIANQQHREGNLDFIVLSGDLVDFKFIDSRKKVKQTFSESEWFYFLQIVDGEYPRSERLEVPLYTSTGNHDYRLYPYRIQAYGLLHCGIPDDITNEYLKESGKLKKIKYSLSDLDALKINTGKNHSLDYYYMFINPFSDYYIESGNEQFIFLDTKADAFCYSQNLFSRRVFSLLSDLEDPASQGLEKLQIEYFKNAINPSKNVSLFCHAPILNSNALNQGIELDNESEISFPEIPTEITKRSILNFQKALIKDELSTGTCFNNQLEIINELISNSKATAVFSGHNHYACDYRLSKTNRRLYKPKKAGSAEIENDFISNVHFFQTPSLTHVKRDKQYIEEPSFRKLAFSDDNLKYTQLIPVKQKPFEYSSSFVVFDKSENLAKVSIHILDGPHSNAIDSIYHRFIVFSKDNSKSSQNEKLVRSISEEECSSTVDDSGMAYWVFAVTGNILEVKIGSNSPAVFQFAIESFIRSDTEVKSLGIRRFNQSLVL